MAKATKELYLRAAEELDKRELCKGSFCDNEPNPKAFCIEGAVLFAAYGRATTEDALNVPYKESISVREPLRVLIGKGEGVFEWNDAPERTKAEVVAKLREIAELLPNEVTL